MNFNYDTTYTETLFSLQDKEYGDFHSALMPGIDRETIIGIRIPILRKEAKRILKEGGYENFLASLPHKYYEENNLHGFLIEGQKDYDKCIDYLDAFLPFVDNWATCDLCSPKVFRKNKAKLKIKIEEWIHSDNTYMIRFGIKAVMDNFLADDFDKELTDLVSSVKSDEYYINMMIAWFFATALAKNWEECIPYIENNCLDKWTHNKTIQKCRESRRITDEHNAYLKTLKC